jgi:hypothetical protein
MNYYLSLYQKEFPARSIDGVKQVWWKYKERVEEKKRLERERIAKNPRSVLARGHESPSTL